MFARPAPRPHEVDLVAVLGGVRVDEDALRARPGRRLAEDPVGAGDGEARAPGEAEPSARRAVPAGEEPLALGERLVRPGEELGRVRRRVVHQGVPARDAQARGLGRAEDGVGVPDGPHVEDRRRPAGGELREAEARGEEEGLLVVRGLARPDVRLQPGEEREVVGAVPEERLAEVDVGLDETGEEPEPLARRPARRPRRGPARRRRRRAPRCRGRGSPRPRPRRRRSGGGRRPSASRRRGRSRSEERASGGVSVRAPRASSREAAPGAAGARRVAPQGAGGAGGQGVSGRSGGRRAVEAERRGDRDLRGEDERDELRERPAPLLGPAPSRTRGRPSGRTTSP